MSRRLPPQGYTPSQWKEVPHADKSRVRKEVEKQQRLLHEGACFLLWLEQKDLANPKTGEDQPLMIVFMGLFGHDVRSGYHLFVNSQLQGYTLAEHQKARGQDRNPAMNLSHFKKKYEGGKHDLLINSRFTCSWQVEQQEWDYLYKLKVQVNKKLDQIKQRIKILDESTPSLRSLKTIETRVKRRCHCLGVTRHEWEKIMEAEQPVFPERYKRK